MLLKNLPCFVWVELCPKRITFILCDETNIGGDSPHNNMGDKLLLNFSAKFQRKFIISHVKLQCCHHGNFSYSAKMVSCERNFRAESKKMFA